MSPTICIFEDNRYSQLYPLSLTRPVFDLRCGMVTLKEKIIRQFPEASISLYCRKYLKDLVQQQNTSCTLNKIKVKTCLFINGRVIMNSQLKEIFSTDEEAIFLGNGQIMGAFLKGENLISFVNLLWIKIEH